MQRPEVPSLTGLRFCAAALVLWAHTVRFARLYPLFFLCVVITISIPRDPSPSLGTTLPFYLTMMHDWSPQVVGNGFLGDAFAPGSWSISAEVFLYLIYIAMARPIYRFLNSEQVILLMIGALVAVVSLFYVGKAAGWW
jgi:peptidoglycan/LPS O-acetylase OafA/YrhL